MRTQNIILAFLIIIPFTFLGQTSIKFNEPNSEGEHNSHFGFKAGIEGNGNFNTFLGSEAGYANQVGSQNIFLGFQTGWGNKGSNNIFAGEKAGFINFGNYNIFFGGLSGQENLDGESNIFLGHGSGNKNERGSQNIFLGGFAGGLENTEGSNNVYVGYLSGAKAKGSKNVFIGSQAGYNETGNNMLYIDNSDTSEPLIYGNFADNILDINGKLGIDTQFPTEKLEVSHGNLKLNGDNESNLSVIFEDEDTGIVSKITGKEGMQFFLDGDEKMCVDYEGNVGIGTTFAAGWKLAVNGKVRAKEIKVETGWSDFVFEEEYDLPTLSEVENHIKEKGHLKDIPSAKEVAKNGIFLGEMDAKLLQKIEELTLYTIEQDKTLKLEQAKNKGLEARLKKLEDLVEKLK